MQRKWLRSWKHGKPDFMAKHILPPVAAASILLATITGAYANPTGGQVTTGAGTIAQSGNTMTITQTTGKLGINWQSFSIGSGEKVQFIQPAASSVALNRVIGTNPSTIYGTLSANGKVFLINPNGVLFAPGAQVNVGGLVASTLNLTDSDFLAGKYNFNGSGGLVVNQGNINATDGGYVAFLGSQVKNEGIIVAQQGTVALAAGSAVTLDMHGDGILNLAVDQGSLQALAENKNLIQADGGRVIMTARASDALADTVVNNTGLIQARSISNINGVIRLDGGANGIVNNSGTLDAAGKTAGQTGGTIKVLGDKVELTGVAAIDVSGANGGGTVLVGGNYQGQGPEQSATNTYVSSGAVINADAINQGSGGNVIVWANNKTEFNGQITARGGATGGDGGSAEVSGKQDLVYGGLTDLRASKGKTGTLILDPTDYNIAASGGDLTGEVLGAQLGSANVTILSSSGASGVNGDLKVSDAVSWSSNNTLTLNADRDVNVNANITATGDTAGLVISPGSGVGGNYNLGKGAKVTLSGANPSLSIAGQSYTIINSVSDLQNMSKNLSGFYALGADINASETVGWNGGSGFTPVGSYPRFSGVFDGSGHTITGLTINRPWASSIGLFGYASGSIRNVGLIDGNFTGYTWVGSLAGQTENASIINCYSTSTVNGNSGIGGLVGGGTGTITGSYNTGAVTGTVSGNLALQHVGGLVGWNFGNITNSYSTGEVNIVNAAWNTSGIGGLVGSNSTGGSITNSYSTGAVSGARETGGLVGYNYQGTVANSYSTGAVTGTSNVGGLLGYYVDGSITNSYSTGAVTGISNVGGLVGRREIGSIINSYWDTTTSGQMTSSGGTGRTTDEMLQSSNYNGWDFANTWYMVDGNTRPFLRSEYSTSITNGHQLQLMALNLGAKYTLANNIDMSELTRTSGMWNTATGFVPIGNYSTEFTGTFDGGGHTIDKLTINRPETFYVGLVGFTRAGAKISNVGLSNVDVHGKAAVGGLVGYNASTIMNSYSTGAVVGNPSGGNGIGGLVGFNTGYGSSITNSYSTAQVSGYSSVGGLVGFNSSGSIANSYSTGTVSSPYSFKGGLVGQTTGGSIANSYWNIVDSGMTTSAGGTGLTTEQMRDHSNFTGWDFTNTWRIYDGYTDPLLKVFMTPIIVTANNASRIYDGSISYGGNGVTYSNPSATLLGTVSYAGTAQGARNAGDYSIIPTGLYSGQQGYDITFVNGTLIIDQRALAVTASGQNKVYDGTTSADVTFSDNRVAGDRLNISGTAVFSDKNVGDDKEVSVTSIALGGADADNYSYNTTALATADITKRGLTLTASADTKTYDGTITSEVVPTLTSGSLMSGDTAAFSQVYADKNAGTGKTLTPTVVIADGNGGNNYAVTYVNNTSGVINKAALTITAAGQNKVYDGTTSADVTFSDNRVAGDRLNISGTAVFSDKNVGEDKDVSVTSIALGGADADNYSYNTTTLATADITKRGLTLTASADTKTYDGTITSAAAPTLASGSLMSGDTAVFSQAYADKNAGAGKTLTPTAVIADGNGGNNYAVTYVNNTSGVINKAALTITAAGQNKVYDGTTGADVTFSDNRVAGDTLTISGTAAFSDKNVGDGKEVSVSGIALVGADADNYSYNTTALATADITKRGLTVTANGQNKVYDGTTNAAVTYDDNRVPGDKLTISGTAAFGDKNVGDNKKVSVRIFALGGTDAGNYFFNTKALTTANITKRGLTITANDASRYIWTSNPDFSATYTGLAGTDTPNMLSGTLSLTTSATPLSALGSYPIIPSGLSSGNYSITYINGSLRITRMPDTYTSALSFAAQTAGSVNTQAGNLSGDDGVIGGARPLINITGGGNNLIENQENSN